MKSNEPKMSKKYDLAPLLLCLLRREPLRVLPEHRLKGVIVRPRTLAKARRRDVGDWSLVKPGWQIVGGFGYMKSWMNHRNGCEPALSQGGRARSQEFTNGADLIQPKCAPWRHPLLSSALPDADVLGPDPPQSSCAVAVWAGCCLCCPMLQVWALAQLMIGVHLPQESLPQGGVDAIAMYSSFHYCARSYEDTCIAFFHVRFYEDMCCLLYTSPSPRD